MQEVTQKQLIAYVNKLAGPHSSINRRLENNGKTFVYYDIVSNEVMARRGEGVYEIHSSVDIDTIYVPN